jgi:tetratricopeptide (TPR) repeat protein
LKIVDYRANLALLTRDGAAARSALAEARDGGCQTAALPFPGSWCEGLAARLEADAEAAQRAFTDVREQTTLRVEQAPDDARGFCVLGLAQAALGNKEAAIEHGRRAVELLPINKDAVDGPLLVGYLAVIYAWSGETEQALQHLEVATSIPSYWSYGNLKLHPQWDPLREHPRFQQIVERLAPRE